MAALFCSRVYHVNSRCVIFQHYYSYTSHYLRYVRYVGRKQIATVVLQRLFSASYYLRSPSTTYGARYRGSSTCIDTDVLRLAAVACCDMGWISAQHGTMRLISVEKDWKHVPMQKVVTLNTCCDIACLTFQLPHITTGSFQSHWWQSTTGSFPSLQCLKERNK